MNIYARWFDEFGNSIEQEPISRLANCKGDVNVPPPSEEEKALQREQLELLRLQRSETEAFKPFLYQTLGLMEDPQTGKLRAMTEEEKVGLMDPMEKAEYELQQQYYDRQMKALKGEIEVSPALEKDLAERKTELEEYLSRRLGNDWQQSTAGIQAMSDYDQSANLLREEARRGQISSGEGLMLSQYQRMADDQNRLYSQNYNTPNRYSGLLSNYGNAMQPYQFQRSMQFNANARNAQNDAGMMMGLGQIAGSLGSAAIIASNKSFKTDKTPINEVEILEKVKVLPVERWRYKAGIDDEGRHIGPYAEDFNETFELEAKPGIHIADGIGVALAAIKALASEVDSLKAQLKEAANG